MPGLILPGYAGPGRLPVTYACPICPIGAPRPFCQCCSGAGNVDVRGLTAFQRAEAEGRSLNDAPTRTEADALREVAEKALQALPVQDRPGHPAA